MADKKPFVNYSGKAKEIAPTDTIPIVNGGSRASISVTQASHGFSSGNAIYFTGTVYAKAKADNADTLGLFIVESVTDVNNFVMVLHGRITGLSGLTAGQYYYVSATTAGALTTTEPAAGLFSNPILFADSTTTGFVVTFRPTVSITPPASSGWDDITPVGFKDDGTGGWSFTTITGNRRELAAVGSGATVSTMFFKYHIPHGIVLNQVDGAIYLHPHLEFTNTNAGNVILTAFISAGLRDGLMSSEFTLTFTITPSAYTPFTQQVIEQALPTGLAQYLVPDAIWTIRFVRDSGAVGDTYTSIVALHTMDIHALFDYKPTTSKDLGTGWVKI